MGSSSDLCEFKSIILSTVECLSIFHDNLAIEIAGKLDSYLVIAIKDFAQPIWLDLNCKLSNKAQSLSRFANNGSPPK